MLASCIAARAGRLGGAQPVGMDRRDRRGPGSDHAERLGDAGHRAGRAHDRAGAGGGREVALDLVDLVGADLAGAEAAQKRRQSVQAPSRSPC